MKNLSVILIVALLLAICAGPVFTSGSDSSSDWSSNSSPDDRRSGQDLPDDVRGIQDSESGELLTKRSDDKDIRIAASKIKQVATFSSAGTTAQQLAAIADEVNQLADDSLEQKNRIRNRSEVVRFLVGGDRVAAMYLHRNVDRLQREITRLEQILSSQDITGEVRSVIQDQLQVFYQERDHLTMLARSESEDLGLFGGMIGSSTRKVL